MEKLEDISHKGQRKEIIKNPGGFCSLFDLKKLKYKDPIILSCTDGIGTKLSVAIKHGKFNFLGFDLVAMCVNDLLASGGEPLFFLDYFSSSKIEEKPFLDLISSITLACKESNCSLVGGETAEMPGMYKNGDFDLAGFSVGVVERSNLLSKSKVKNNSTVIGLESSGFHSNGYSLIRKVIKNSKIKLSDPPPYKSSMKTLGDDLLIPTRIYVKDLLPLIKKNLISSIAHITGGGIFENLSRIVPRQLKSTLDNKKFEIPERFIWIKEQGKINKVEMLKTFNCGIGMILIINKENKEDVFDYLFKKKIKYHLLGIVEKTKLSKNVEIKNFGIWDLI